MRVLVVEDEEPIASAIERGLTKIGYAVDVAYDGAEALEKAGVNAYDVVCLDLNLPRVDGVEVCRKLRADHFRGGIIMLTARSGIRDRVEGLDEGADDYLVKPFAFSELAARIRAISRREGSMREPVLATRRLELDPNTNRARRDEVEIHLTPKEFAPPLLSRQERRPCRPSGRAPRAHLGREHEPVHADREGPHEQPPPQTERGIRGAADRNDSREGLRPLSRTSRPLYGPFASGSRSGIRASCWCSGLAFVILPERRRARRSSRTTC